MHLEPQVSFFSLIILACISLIIIVYRTYYQYHHSTRLWPNNVHNGLEMHHSRFNPR